MPDFFFCYAFERMNTSKMTQMERDGFFSSFFLLLLLSMYRVLTD